MEWKIFVMLKLMMHSLLKKTYFILKVYKLLMVEQGEIILFDF